MTIPYDKFSFKAAAILGATGVALGAFGAHGLKNLVQSDPSKLAAWKTASNYQLIHSAVLLSLSIASPVIKINPMAGKLIALGTTLFSGSIYTLILTGGKPRILGPVTPLGGIIMIGGWISLLF